MGTNYYLRLKEEVFENCHPMLRVLKNTIIQKTSLHIGKCSAGWRFLFQEQTGVFGKINSFGKWQDLIADNNLEIIDEYNELQNKTQFMEMVESKQTDKHHDPTLWNYVSEDGYDFSEGDFS